MVTPKVASKPRKVAKHSAKDPNSIEVGPISEAQSSLQNWFHHAARDLPWRRLFSGKPMGQQWTSIPRRDPYATWISESMLQQTQVETVLRAYQRWLKDFPTLGKLAKASESNVLEHWSGLGYYRRAKNLLKAAQTLSERGLSNLPDTREALLAIPGVGEYTVGAILSLAFNRQEPILDGNVVRVMSRFHKIEFRPETGDEKQHYWERARAWATHPQPGEINEALMELGALICTAKQPRCQECPLKKSCLALKSGQVDQLPPVKIREKSQSLSGEAFILRKGQQFLLMRVPTGDLLAGHWCFPLKWDKPEKPESSILAAILHASRKKGVQTKGIQHSITKYRIRLEVTEREWVGPNLKNPNLEWVSHDQLSKKLVTSLSHKIWKAYQSSTST